MQRIEYDRIIYSADGLKSVSMPEPEEAPLPEYVFVTGENDSIQLDTGDCIRLISFTLNEEHMGEISQVGESGDVEIEGEWVEIDEYNVLMVEG